MEVLEKVLLGLLMLPLMAGLGATLGVEDFRVIARRPGPVLIGVASQYGFMPAIAAGLAAGLQLDAELAVALILIGSTPGGTTSNLFTYYAGADVALSVAMTTVSTLVALVMMPLVLSLYAARYTSEALTIPIGSIVTTLAIVLVPVAVGMAVRHRKGEETAKKWERAGSLAGTAVLAILIVFGLFKNGAAFALVPLPVYVAACALGPIGMAFGYGAAGLFRLGPPQRRAVAFETGIQNSALAIAIVKLAFEGEQGKRMVRVPLLYALFVITIASGIAWAVRRRTAEVEG